MNGSNLEDIILQAIDIVATKKINAAGYDKTIQAIIVSCIDLRIGKYKVKYQDSYFFAYSNNTNVNYLLGTSVYVLIPNGNMSNDKTILGTVKGLGIDYNEITEQDRYIEVGNNVLASNDSYSLCSYKTEQKILYSKDLAENIIDIDKLLVSEYIKNSEALLLKFYIQTAIPSLQRYQGNYGILFGLDFLTENNLTITRYYYMDVDSMTGNPYNFINKVKQEKTFEIDNLKFVLINLISIFSKDFPYQREGENDDIFITLLSLNGIDFLSSLDLESYALTLITPAGYIFAESELESAERPILAQLRVKGKVKDLDVNVYWFRLNSNIISGSLKYSSYGGQGWLCLNLYEIISDDPLIYDFIPSGKIYTVTKSDLYSERTRYKCVILYENNILSKEITMIKSGAEYKFLILSSGGTVFHFNQGETLLTCKVYQKVDSLYTPITTFTGMTFSWIKINNANNFLNINTTVSQINEYALLNKIYNTNIRAITNFIIYKCSVLDTTTGTCLGTASITLTNDTLQDINVYNLVINNGNQLFKYNTYGIAPTSRRLDTPQAIPALTFTLYNAQGQQIDNSLIDASSIVWNVPNKDTLLKPDSSYSGQVSLDGNIISFTNLTSFVYTIALMYNFSKTNNNILLLIVYDGVLIKTKTNLLFTKLGLDGTNGTEFVCKIIPNVVNGDYPVYPTIYCHKNGNTLITNFNWNQDSSNTWFKVQLWNNNNEPIFTGSKTDENSRTTLGKPISIKKWEILQNFYGKYTSNNITTVKQDNSNISVSYSNDWNYSIVSTNSPFLENYDLHPTDYQTWRPADVLKVTVLYDNKTYYATLPIVVSRLFYPSYYRVSLKDYSGFLRVLYNNNGQLPQYSNTLPFEIITELNQDGEWVDVRLITEDENPLVHVSDRIYYDWYYQGSTMYKDSSIQSGNDPWVTEYETTDSNGESSKKWLTKAYTYGTLLKNQMYIRPMDTYDGLCVNTGIACRVHRIYNSTDTTLAWIHIPIHMSFNRFGIAAINDWDGNSIELGNNGGMILAPQVGAGTKDNNNAFTGVVIGTSRDPNLRISNGKEDVGLFAYSAGKRSVFIDAKTGKATFGETGLAQIIIDPTQTVNGRKVAEIRSGNYAESTQSTTGTGLLIDLTSPAIKFGSGKFSVNSNGVLNATGAIINGAITATSLNVTGATLTGFANVATSGSYNDLTSKPTIPDISICIRADGSVHGNVQEGSSGIMVSQQGLLQASNAIIYGTLYSSAGKIAGLTLSGNSMSTTSSSGEKMTINERGMLITSNTYGNVWVSDGHITQQGSPASGDNIGKAVDISNGRVALYRANETTNYSLSLDTFKYATNSSYDAYNAAAITSKLDVFLLRNDDGYVYFLFTNKDLNDKQSNFYNFAKDYPNFTRFPVSFWRYIWVNEAIYCLAGSSGKHNVVKTEDYGKRVLTCYETPTPMYGDVGQGIISEDGFCYINLDPVFSLTISISNYNVFLQKEDLGDCFIYEKKPYYFIVKGTPNLKFSWEIKVKQKNMEQKRLEVFENDSYKIPLEVNYAYQAENYIQELNQLRRV